MNKKTRSLSLKIALTFIGLSALFGQSLLAQTENVPFDIEPDFVPCGWMGAATTSVILETNFVDNSRPDNQATQITYQAGGSESWAGIYWLPPDGRDCNWGQNPGIPIVGATKVTFWAKSKHAGESIQFKVGGVRSDKPHFDTFSRSRTLDLTTDWKQYEIDISDQTFTEVLGAFAWVTSNPRPEGVTFYLDDIRYE